MSREDHIKLIFDEAFEIFKDRNETYGDSGARHGNVMSCLFPDGVTLKTPEDFRRYTYISGVIGKLNRYVQSFQTGGHRDSAIDPINMLAMLLQCDEELQDEDS